jgi:hypothetical protein
MSKLEGGQGAIKLARNAQPVPFKDPTGYRGHIILSRLYHESRYEPRIFFSHSDSNCFDLLAEEHFQQTECVSRCFVSEFLEMAPLTQVHHRNPTPYVPRISIEADLSGTR